MSAKTFVDWDLGLVASDRLRMSLLWMVHVGLCKEDGHFHMHFADFDQVEGILDELVDQKMLAQLDAGYVVTPRGRRALGDLAEAPVSRYVTRQNQVWARVLLDALIGHANWKATVLESEENLAREILARFPVDAIHRTWERLLPGVLRQSRKDYLRRVVDAGRKAALMCELLGMERTKYELESTTTSSPVTQGGPPRSDRSRRMEGWSGTERRARQVETHNRKRRAVDSIDFRG